MSLFSWLQPKPRLSSVPGNESPIRYCDGYMVICAAWTYLNERSRLGLAEMEIMGQAAQDVGDGMKAEGSL